MALKSITHDDQVMRGANADLWEVAEQYVKLTKSEKAELARARRRRGPLARSCIPGPEAA